MNKNYFLALLFSVTILISNAFSQTPTWVVYGCNSQLQPRVVVQWMILQRVWVATFGGGVSAAKSGSYVNYNSTNSGLTDDYATATAVDNSWENLGWYL
jgi:hypothetical protein